MFCEDSRVQPAREQDVVVSTECGFWAPAPRFQSERSQMPQTRNDADTSSSFTHTFTNTFTNIFYEHVTATVTTSLYSVSVLAILSAATFLTGYPQVLQACAGIDMIERGCTYGARGVRCRKLCAIWDYGSGSVIQQCVAVRCRQWRLSRGGVIVHVLFQRGKRLYAARYTHHPRCTARMSSVNIV